MTYYKYNGSKGERYFKMDDKINFPDNERVIQVCISPGKAKTGRANCIGIYVIKRLTLLSNYAFSAQLNKCSKKEYTTAFNKILKTLNEI